LELALRGLINDKMFCKLVLQLKLFKRQQTTILKIPLCIAAIGVVNGQGGRSILLRKALLNGLLNRL